MRLIVAIFLSIYLSLIFYNHVNAKPAGGNPQTSTRPPGSKPKQTAINPKEVDSLVDDTVKVVENLSKNSDVKELEKKAIKVANGIVGVIGDTIQK